MKLRRVKITGIGPVTPAGVGREAFWKGIQEPVSRVTVINRFPEEAGPFVAAEVEDFGFDKAFPHLNERSLPRHTCMALLGARLALDDAGLAFDSLQGTSPLVSIGAALMDSDIINRTIANVALKGPRHALPRVVPNSPVSGISTAVAREIGGRVRTITCQSACCSGVDAIGQAVDAVARGEVDIAICGGAEAPIYYHPMLELKIAGLSPNTADRPAQLGRPFDLWRTTGVIGEGACLLVIEPEDSPREGYAFILGYGFATDTNGHQCDALRDAIRRAVINAKLRFEEIDSINCWGPGHRRIDAEETAAIYDVFGPRAAEFAAFSIKGAIGNPFAAAGAIQVTSSALGLEEKIVPPTVNWEYPDPNCRLNLANRARYLPSERTLINSHGISGTNACLVMERCR